MTGQSKHDLFATTRWTIVLRAGGSLDGSATVALEELCRIYWFPLYGYVRGRGYSREDAEDMTQGFFTQLLRRDDFSGLGEQKGKFRAFLLASLKHYIANEYDRSSALKRGGGVNPLSLDWEAAEKKFQVVDESAGSPDQLFDRQWALALLERVLARLEREWMDKGKTALFQSLKDFLTVNRDDGLYGTVSAKMGVTENYLRVAAHRLHKRYRELLKEEIAHTLSEPDFVEEELKNLMQIFS